MIADSHQKQRNIRKSLCMPAASLANGLTTNEQKAQRFPLFTYYLPFFFP